MDADGNIYITGQTASADFPSTKRLSAASTNDIFVAKVDPSGRNVLYSVIVGAGTAAAITVDPAGNAYVAGVDPADTFPVTAGSIPTTGRCFLFKLNPTGSDLAYSTRLPCNGTAAGKTYIGANGLAVDAAGAAYVTGFGPNIVTTPGAYLAGDGGPFAMKVNPQGSALAYSTYLTGTETYDMVRRFAVTVDAQGNAYFTGRASGGHLTPTVQPLPQYPGSGIDVAVLELSPDGSKALFATLFGGSGAETGAAIAVDAEGFIYVTGATNKSGIVGFQFPTTAGAFNRDPGDLAPGYLVKLTPGAASAVFSGFLSSVGEGSCISVSQDGIDVIGSSQMTGWTRLMRVSLDGATLVNSSMVSLTNGICGQQGGLFALAGSTGTGAANPRVVTSPDLSPIGPRGSGDVWFSTIESDAPEAPEFSLDRGALRLYSWAAPGGTSATATIHANLSAGTVPLGISTFYGHVSVEPALGTAPADVVVSAPGGTYSDSLYFFAPGARGGLVDFPLNMSVSNIMLSAQPLTNGSVALSATGPQAPPVSVMLRVSSAVATNIFGTPDFTPVPVTVQLDAPAPPWLKVDPASGTTPTALRITVDPAGLAIGVYRATIHLLGPAIPPDWTGVKPTALDIPVVFTVGAAAPAPPPLAATPADLSFRLTPDQLSSSGAIHLTSGSGDPVAFTIDATPSWLTVTPSSGTTPADLKVTATVAQATNRLLETTLQIRRTSDNAVAAAAQVVAAAVLPTYTGMLRALPLSPDPWGYSRPSFAPGGLFYIGVDRLMPTPAGSFNAPPGALPTSLGGFSFKLNGVLVPLRSYDSASHSFLAQIPAELQFSPYAAMTLAEFDSSGARIAAQLINLDYAAPKYLVSLPDGLRARRANGSIADETNPVRPGEHITVKLTGQGAVQPAVASGFAAPAGVNATPLLAVTASFPIVSAVMSHSEAGVLEVTLEVPDVPSGDYSIGVRVWKEYTPTAIPVRILAGPVVPQIQAGGVVNAASYLPQIAPGSLFSIFGSGLAAGIAKAGRLPLPTTLAGVSVTIGGKQAPLLYVSPGQINGQAPYEVAADPAAPVVVTVNGVSSNIGTASIVAAAPGIFEFGENRAVVQNQDYSLNSTENGAAPRSTTIAYLTGSGALDIPVATGSAAPLSPLSRALENIAATVNGVPAAVTFAGLAPTLIGVMQVNFQVPDLPPGTYPVVFTTNGDMSNSALVTVK